MPGQLDLVHPATTRYTDASGDRVPAVFTDYEEEYEALRSFAGLFDHSSLRLIKVTGDVHTLLQEVLARDVEFMTPDQSVISLMLADDGDPIDLVTVYLFDDYALVECARGSGDRTLEHLRAKADGQAEVEWLADYAVMAVEGPYAWAVVGEVVDRAITALPYEGVTTVKWGGGEFIFARSGFTGEYGYKFIGPVAIISSLWEAFSPHARPIGYDALETAMIEVRQPVLYLECHERDVVTAGLNWLVDPTKEDFCGRRAVLDRFEDPDTPRTIGLRVEGGPVEPGAPVRAGSDLIGEVAVAVRLPKSDAYLALATIPSELASAGLELTVGDGLSARSVAAPYVVPMSWTTPML
jgi:aminomethyltransferase